MHQSFASSLMFRDALRRERAETAAAAPAPAAANRFAEFVLSHPVACSPQSAVLQARAVARHTAPEAPAAESCARCESRPFAARVKLAFEVLVGRECDCCGDAA